MASERVRAHDVTLEAGAVGLRPLTEDDWDLVVGLWNDPEVACYSDEEPRTYTTEQVQGIVRGISGRGFVSLSSLREGRWGSAGCRK